MTEPTLMVNREINSFEERVDSLARELELSIRWERPCVLFVVFGSEYVRAEVQNALENTLVDLGQRAVHYKIKDGASGDVLDFLQKHNHSDQVVYFFHGLHWWTSNESSNSSLLNLQRDLFVEKHLRAVFWLTRKEIHDIAHQTPDFWVFRQRSIEFVEAPKDVRVMMDALESTWQDSCEYDDAFDDIEAKISLRESMLAELPVGSESSSIRAQLLLNLGILNWRMGEFEKSNEQLLEVLDMAENLKDDWFQAECQNALALLRTSMDREEESIQAYQKAIQLAPNQVFASNNLGNLYFRIGKLDEAIGSFQNALRINPNDPIALNGMGNVLLKQGCPDNAMTAFRRSIQCLPTFSQPWIGLGMAYETTGRNEDAMKAYQKATEANEKSPTPWLQLASLYARQERFTQAEEAYKKALELNDTDSRVWNELGVLYNRQGAYQQAEETFVKAIELDRANAWAYSNLGVTLTYQGRSKESVSLFLRSIDFFLEDHERAVSWNRLGDAYRQLNDYNNAIAAYQTADMLDIGTPHMRYENPLSQTPIDKSTNSETRTVKQVFADTPEWVFDPDYKAITIDDEIQPETESNVNEPDLEIKPAPVPLKTISQVNPDAQPSDELEQLKEFEELESADAESTNAVVWNEKGNVHFKQGAIEEAINAYNKAIQFDTEFGWPYSNLALAYLAQGQHTEAILLYQRSIELLKSDQDKAISWNGLGNVHRRMSNYADAIKAYQKAAELDPATAGVRDGVDQPQAGQLPANPNTWNELGELFYKSGSYAESIRAFERAISLDPQSGWSLSNLARSLAAQGKYALAIPLYQKSIEILKDDKDKAAVWNRLGNVYRKLHDYEHAIDAYQKAVALTDEDAALLTRTRFSLLSNLPVD